MIKRELAKDPTLKNENWERFLPNFKKRNVQRKKPKAVQEKREYTPFPPAQPLSKVDQMLESGEYFLSEEVKAARRKEAQNAKQQAAVEARKREREAAFVAPEEDGKRRRKPEPEPEAKLSDQAGELRKKLKGEKKHKSHKRD